MKRLLAVLLLGAATASFALEPNTVNRSSYVATAGTGYVAASYLDGIVVGVATAGGTLMIYNSTWTNSVQISSISLATVGNYYFNNLAVKGLYYLAATPTNGVTILYKK